MRIKFYVISQDTQVYACFITNSNIHNYFQFGRKSRKEAKENVAINPYFFYILYEFQISQLYRLSLARYIKKLSHLVIKIIPPQKEFLDKVWGEIVRQIIWEAIETDYMFSWFSTLGGAFSALGDEARFSVLAFRVSIQQIKLVLAKKFCDLGLLARCKLFLSISLIQQRKFKLARRIIEEQYYFGKSTGDKRLIKMCFGIWSKLQYSHKIFKNKKQHENK